MTVKTISIIKNDEMSFVKAISRLRYKENIMRRRSWKDNGISDYFYLGKNKELMAVGDEIELLTQDEYSANDWVIQENKNL